MPYKKPPHIVMIVLDTHRRDRISAYGYHRPTTPHLDSFAQTAAVFDNAISAAQWTIPAHASMFSGEYPTTHQTLQAHAMLDGRFDTVATLLRASGYQTTGFCNNPLLGVLNNGLKRGFDTFYNYCGAVPSVPGKSNRLPKPLDRAWEWWTQQLRKASYPVQNAFAHSDFLFQASLHPKIVPLWSKFANFKGHTVNCTRDVTEFMEAKIRPGGKPQFVFVNLMETHLPYHPPDTFIDKFAPYFKDNRQTRDFLRRYNVETFRWLLPIPEPLADLEAAVLNDLYDAEVNYQDHLLGPLLEQLSQAEDVLTIIVADHGEGIGEHNFLGHSFVAYNELVHVPLFIKFPDQQAAGQRISDTVSTRRLFHTMIHAAGIEVFETEHRPATDVKRLSLAQNAAGRNSEPTVFIEAYPPTTFLTMMEKRAPDLIEPFGCTRTGWAVYEDGYKLLRLDGRPEELYHLATDPGEIDNLTAQKPEVAAQLMNRFKPFLQRAIERQPATWQSGQLNLEENEQVTKQLRALGYIE